METQNQGIEEQTKPNECQEKKKENRGRKAGSYKYEIPGKGKVPIAEYKKWKKSQVTETSTNLINNNQ